MDEQVQAEALDLTEIADANLTNVEIEEGIEAQMALVGPILTEFFKAAAEGRDFWLKKKSLKIVADWIISLQNIASMMEQQIEQMGQVITAQDAELTELRPDQKRKVWTPGP